MLYNQTCCTIIVQNLELPYNVKLKTQVVTDRVPSGFKWDSCCSIRVITKLPNSEQSYKGKVKTHKYINRQNQSTTGKLGKP
jgi:hypothetical protein